MDVTASPLTDDDDMDTSLFDDIIRLYQMLLENVLDSIKSYVFDDVKARSRPYRTEKYVCVCMTSQYSWLLSQLFQAIPISSVLRELGLAL